MRKFDKLKNLKKANILAEQRYFNQRNGMAEVSEPVPEDNYNEKILHRITELLKLNDFSSYSPNLKGGVNNGPILEASIFDSLNELEYFLTYSLETDIIDYPDYDQGDRWTPQGGSSGAITVKPIKLDVVIWDGKDETNTEINDINNPEKYFTEKMNEMASEKLNDEYWLDYQDNDSRDPDDYRDYHDEY